MFGRQYYKSSAHKQILSHSTTIGESALSKKEIPMLGERLFNGGSIDRAPTSKFFGPRKDDVWFVFILIAVLVVFGFQAQAFAATKIPGADASDKLEAAGTLLRIIDSVLFSWGARIFAGLCILGAGWNLKEQRFGMAVLSVVAAIVLGTAPTWVKNIFDIGGGGGVFSQGSVISKDRANA